jgi:hypothetical protein
MPTRDLPDRPNLSQYKKQAKDLVKACLAGDADALRRVREAHARASGTVTLADAQFVIAREHGDESWSKFATRVEAAAARPATSTVWRQAERAVVAGDVATLERLLRAHETLFREDRPPASTPGGLAPDYSGGDARQIIARNHEFEGWDGFERFQRELKRPSSPVARFERAADAIVTGDLALLERLLAEDSDLIRARSVRRHHSTLLHYVGANGVEYFRQKTPRNAPDVARVLLRAGADIEAPADMYGGGSTTVGLVATSITPVVSGVLVPLLEVLLDHGAVIDKPGAASIVNGCLRNGRLEAAQFLAGRGAPLDLEGAAGVGRLDLVERFFDASGNLRAPATRQQMADGFTWACEFGHAEVVECLLERGVEIGARVKHHGQTGLHWAAGGGHIETVKVLLGRGAPVDAEDETWKATPIQWAFFGLMNPTAPPVAPDRYYSVMSLLVTAGATVKPEWRANARELGDNQLLAALGER